MLAHLVTSHFTHATVPQDLLKSPKRRPPLHPHRHGPHSTPSSRPGRAPITGVKGPRYSFFAARTTPSANSYRNTNPGHPVAQRRKQACRAQSYTSVYDQRDVVSTGMLSMLYIVVAYKLSRVDRIRRRYRAEVSSASNRSKPQSSPVRNENAADRSNKGHLLHALTKTQLASQRLIATPLNALTRLVTGLRNSAGQRSSTGRKRPRRRMVRWTVYLRGGNPHPICPVSDRTRLHP